ncbi:hypothetical protein EJF36_12870 [Bacillus sp. HMF5848]|uniref:HAAS signaling domain-containing protein n=1 Tax=Bacillus sp. HMF5848 TaxID=2495421 RepID=UPI000F7B1FB5|nr:hypothetical protein [Bacillus sp. HMF5848]RSK27693.1 hypothetical protein EJF36_12870 [Bacillus sp. HMF5848]
MKLIEQYLYVIEQNLPYKGREDIISELRSLILDEIEEKYGPEPTEEQVEKAIQAYGSPREVANRYRNGHVVIGSSYTDLFFFINKIILLSLTIAFSVVFTIELFSTAHTTNEFFIRLVNVPLQILTAALSAIGMQTIVFILITRYFGEQQMNFEENWSPKKLKDIEIGPKPNSKLESILSIIFISVAIVVLNAAPEIILLLESSFQLSGITLTHTINVNVLKGYILFISAVWLAEIMYHIVNLLVGVKTKKIALYELIVKAATLILAVIIITDTNLYVGTTSLLGIRAIFVLIAILALIEVVSKTMKFIKYYLLKSYSSR